MNKTITILQKQLIKGILKKEGLENTHPVAMHLQPSEGESEGKSKNNNYASVIGLLMYLAIAMRPDITYTIFRLRSYMVNPSLLHWTAAK